MTISNTTTEQIYQGDGVTTSFAIPFAFTANSQVQVILRDYTVPTAVTETTLTAPGQYSISGGDPGSAVVTVSTPTATQRVLVRRVTPVTQETDYISTGIFPPETNERTLDRIVQQVQEVVGRMRRALLFGSTSPDRDKAFPDLAINAGKVLSISDDGTGVQARDPSEYLGIAGPPGPAGAVGPAGPATVTLQGFGTAPNANGLTLSGAVLNMEPADATNPGGVSTLTQLIAGLKKFVTGVSIKETSTSWFSRFIFTSSVTQDADRDLTIDLKNAARSLTFSSDADIAGTNSGDVSLAAVGSSPSANGASLSGQVLTLQPADGSQPGLLTAIAQTIAGVKTFANNIIAQAYVMFSAADTITAFAGGGQASATQLAKQQNRVSVCATANDSVKLPAAVAGMQLYVQNSGAASCDVFPASGEAIDAGAADAAFALASGSKVFFFCMTSGTWRSFQGAGGSSLSLATFGSTPGTSGATLVADTLTIQPADATNPGSVSTAAQSFGGAKSFVAALRALATLQGSEQTDAAATGANATLATPTKTSLLVTDGSLTSIDMIPAPPNATFLVLINRTGASVNLNDDTGGTAANRIRTGTGAAIAMADGAAVILYYETASSRWQVVGGSGSGSGGGSGWTLDGNTVLAEKFFGTIDDFKIPFRVNNIEIARWYKNFRLTLGSTPTSDDPIGTAVTTEGRVNVMGDATGANSYGALALGNNRASPAASDIAGILQFFSLNNGTSPSASTRLVGYIRAILRGVGTTNGKGADLGFFVKPDASTTPVEMLTLTATSRMGVNKASPAETLHLDGTLAIDVDDSTATGTTDDVTSTGITVFRLAPATARTVGGISGGGSPRMLWVVNTSATADVTISHQGAGSTSANRIRCPQARDLVLKLNEGALLVYNTTDTRWDVVLSTGGAKTPDQSNFTGSSITPTNSPAQRFRYTGGSAQTFTITTSSMVDGAEIEILGTSNANYCDLAASSTVLLQGDWRGQAGSIIRLRWDAGLAAVVEIARNGI